MPARAASPAAGALPPDIEALATLPEGTSYADAVRKLLGIVRAQLGMQVAWTSEFAGGEQVLRFVDADEDAVAPEQGTRLPLDSSFCARVLDGRFPSFIADTAAVPAAALLDVTKQLRIGSYVGVPLLGPCGLAVGMLCAIRDRPSPDLSERDVAALSLMAQLLYDLQVRALSVADAADERERMHRALGSVIAGAGRHPVLQPIVDLVSGRAVAAEGLTRFTAASPISEQQGASRSPAQWFDDAGRLGLCEDLELATAVAVLDLLDGAVPDPVAVTVNLSPATIVAGRFDALLKDRPLHRVIIEMTEHAPVEDYEQLADTLQPYRDAGLRIAVDDAGAGYSSLRHVLAVRPDYIKIDMALVRRADADLARRTLLTALADFAEATGCQLVAEGVETDGELRAVASCGVHLAQGYLLGRPSRSPSWSGFAVP